MKILKNHKSMKKWGITYAGIALFIILLNLIARFSTTFSNAYIDYILPIWVGSYGRFMGIFPFSVGEVLIVAALLLLVIGIVLALVLFIRLIVRIVKKGRSEKKGFIKIAVRYYLCLAWILLIVFLSMTLNCFIMYHGSTFAEMYFQTEEGSITSSDEYTLEELITVRNFVVEQCNRLSEEVSRDSSGNTFYEKDMTATAIETMQELGEVYPRLAGYYPRLKPLLMSDFYCQQYIKGYFFPFSMEATYNNVMFLLNKPATMCHELAHLKGYILEDEANFIGFLACIESEDIFFQYSGYLSVLNYMDNDFYRSVGRDRELYEMQPEILQQVREDNVFVTSEEWDRIESKAWFKTETVDAVTDALVDASLKANGVQDGILSYSRVVKLVIEYYNNP